MGLRKCVICGKEIKRGYGHNPAPIKTEGRCCDSCDDLYVLPMRLAQDTKNGELAQIVLEHAITATCQS